MKKNPGSKMIEIMYPRIRKNMKMTMIKASDFILLFLIWSWNDSLSMFNRSLRHI